MSFKELNLSNQLLKALDEMGLTEPTTIQQRAFAPIMAGRDVLGIAQTGTGKTYAYLLPLMRLWKYSKAMLPEILILVPTRELVIQVLEETNKLGKYSNILAVGAYGGGNINVQMAEVHKGANIVVATPGRLLDLILKGTINPKLIKKLVIDEVDEMLNLGFRTQINNILDLLPERRQNLMFSATMTDEVQKLLSGYNFNNPEKIEAAPTGTPLANITQIGYKVPNFYTKVNFLVHLLETDKSMTKVLIFAGSKKLADAINELMELKFPDQLAVIHSNKAQNQRFKTVREFESGENSILIATDIIARGLDVSGVSHVINMDVPNVPENYMHRIGRTGRADKKGISITFINDFDKENKLKVEELMGRKIAMKKMPAEVEVSTVLISEEQPKVHEPFVEKVKIKKVEKGASFHEKKDKNKKVNQKITREDQKKKKYGRRYKKEHRKD
ncbi:MAG: DEAD/DEAH box helicase [Bacteroidetes bacterium]|nr:DEAD/DEAH box helicase [Bacteroidota bacterium]